jgi:hypothetical protein
MATAVQRSDPVLAKSVMERLCPDSTERKRVLQRLLTSINAADALAPTAWSVTLADNGFRLNVGQALCLEYREEHQIRIWLAASSTRLVGHEFVESTLAGGSVAFVGPFTAYSTRAPEMEAGHIEYIRLAATKKDGGPREGTRYKESHCQGLVDYARGELAAKVERGQRAAMTEGGRLPSDVLKQVTAEHIYEAVEFLIAGGTHPFGESTNWDLLARDSIRLPPKAVFGVALSRVVGYEVLPGHFHSGDESLALRLLRSAGFRVVPKGESSALASELDADDLDDGEWDEGARRLVSHVRAERTRQPGLASAKKAQFKRQHKGRLFCERCKTDPVQVYETEEAESCIEVHHARVAVAEMAAGHKTKLSDLEVLCANCHRLVHRLMRAGRA